jgi:hypothetical protein
MESMNLFVGRTNDALPLGRSNVEGEGGRERRGKWVLSYLGGDNSLQQLSRHFTTQSGLGSKKKAACNINIFNLKFLIVRRNSLEK